MTEQSTRILASTAGETVDMEQKIKDLLKHATTLERTGQINLAREGFKQAKTMTQHYFGHDHRLHAECLHNLALFNYGQGDFVATRTYGLRALEVLTRILTTPQLHDDQMWQDLLLLLHQV